MGRRYIIPFESVAAVAAQDIVQVKGASGVQGKVIRAWASVTDGTLPAAQMLSLRCRVLPATVTDGNTGGGAGVLNKVDPTDANATLTAMLNNTVKATTTGTAQTVDEQGVYIFNGYQSPQSWERPDSKSAPVIRSTSSFVFELLAAPTGTIHLSGGIEVEESGA